MRFQVPQFIDVESKVFGPFSFRQFIFIAGAAGIAFIFLRIFPRVVAIIAILPVALFATALAFNFYKPSGQPFINLVEAFFKFYVGPRLYIWKRTEKRTSKEPTLAEQYLRLEVPKLNNSKLKDLTWTIDARKEDGKKE